MQTKRAKQFKALLAEEKRLMSWLNIEATQKSTAYDLCFDRWFWRNTPSTTSAIKSLTVVNNLYAKLGGEPKTLDDYRALLEV